MKKIMKTGLFAMVVIALTSCSKESELENTISPEHNIVFNVSDQTENMFYSETVDYPNFSQNYPETQRCGSSTAGYNNLDLCGSTYGVGSIVGSTYWNILDNGPGSIDHELEQLFNYSFEFSYTYIRPNGPPTQIVYGEVEFHESPSFNMETFEYDIYNYTDSNSISNTRANELVEHFACAIDAYRDANLPNALISQVNFFGDVLLCTGSNSRYIKASFRLAIHGGGKG